MDGRGGGGLVDEFKEVKPRSKMVGYLSLRANAFRRWHKTRPRKQNKTPSVAYRFAFFINYVSLVRFPPRPQPPVYHCCPYRIHYCERYIRVTGGRGVGREYPPSQWTHTHKHITYIYMWYYCDGVKRNSCGGGDRGDVWPRGNHG